MADCLIVGAGPFYGLAASPAPADFIIAADGGWLHCQSANLRPHLLLGDFDSLGEPPAGVEILRYPADKDDTDTMLAVKEGLARGYRTFHLYGGTGGRTDHTIANLQSLAYLAKAGARGYLYDASFVFTAFANGSLTLPARPDGIFSVFAFTGEARGVTISGGRYPLEDGVLSPAFPLGVSNHFCGSPVTIQVTDGCLLAGWDTPP